MAYFIIGVIFFIFLIVLVSKMSYYSYKIGYYEQTFKNNKSLFSDDRYNKIKTIMDCTNIHQLNELS